jgi:glycosyltransferase involved in cell wall biosynthesis
MEAAAWELLLVDNASQPPLAGRVDLTGLPAARMVREERLGLTRARLAALAASRGELLVLVDDDNELAPDYLARARRIMAERPDLGAIGGRRLGAFEVTPPPWARLFLNYLAVHEGNERPRWTHERDRYEPWFPAGAGLVIRRELMERYARKIAADARRLDLDRIGERLGGSGDIDILLTVIDAGQGVGYFPELALTHLIPRERLAYDYLRRLVFESMRSFTRLERARDPRRRPCPWPLEYLRSWAMCARANQWHPRAWALAAQIARGRYAAHRESEHDTE